MIESPDRSGVPLVVIYGHESRVILELRTTTENRRKPLHWFALRM